LIDFFLNEKFIIPFLATVGASSTIILMQFYSRRVKETKQKIYAINYICDVAYRILFSQFIIIKHTIKPHIEATERIVEGDHELLAETFMTDEFDILKSQSPSYSHLPNEFSLQLGYDDIKLVQLFETLLYLHQAEQNRLDLNEFVKKNLKSMELFVSKTTEKQQSILYTYHNYLTTLEHESNRVVLFIIKNLTPAMNKYMRSYSFWLYSTKNAKSMVNDISILANENTNFIPENDYMEQVKNGGIQGKL
jgi:hypothetical protein